MTESDHFDSRYHLKPDNDYTANGTHYHTDGQGRITQFDGDLQRAPAPRSAADQANLEGKQPGEHAGHYMAASRGGSGRVDNLGRFEEKVNARDYRSFERENDRLVVDKGNQVTLHGSVAYEKEGNRPEAFMVNRDVTDPHTGQTTRDYFGWTNYDMSRFEGDDRWLETADAYPNPGDGQEQDYYHSAGARTDADRCWGLAGGETHPRENGARQGFGPHRHKRGLSL